jgi:hypothetical protein
MQYMGSDVQNAVYNYQNGKKIYTAYVFMLTYYTYLIKVIPNTFDHSSSGMEGYVQSAKIM